ncbi:MAG TPA: glycosyltransferase family 1 protein [Ktedonobacterales bacterium]|nr:glycosyltransferase family 1 protein [Ktedonobacterales bacterium]
MRVAFNAQFLQEPRTGTGRYVFNLLQSLGRVDGMTDYLVLSPHEPRAVPDTPSTFRWEVAPAGKVSRGGENIEKVWWEQRTFPLAAKRGDATIMHIPHFASPMRTYGIPTIVTIHDVIGLRLPAYRASPRVQAYTQLVARAAKHARMVVAVSEHCKRDIIETLGIPEERVRVIREAPVMAFRRVTDPVLLAEVREKYGLGERFVLNIGGVDQRKNIAGLVGAFAAVYHELGDPDLQLFIAGDPKRLGSSPLFPDWRPLTATFGIADNVVCAPVDEEDLPLLYSAASCFAFASVYEGFGLTPLEAMACGAPVVCSDRTSLPEVVGSAGLLANPEDPDAFGAAIKRVLASQQLRDDLGARGMARVKLFSWDRVAVETSALYAEVAGTKRD